MDQTSTLFTIQDPRDMINLGVAMSGQLVAGDIVLLSGGIGAGKSLVCRSIIQALLPEPEDVPSPTFTLVQTYETPDFEIWHCDLYRLTSLDQIDELGLWDALEDSLVLVEWPDLILDHVPKQHIAIQIDVVPGAETRQVMMSAPKERVLFP